jgi:hypothetical protein
MKIVVHAPEPKPAKKVEPVVGGVYAFYMTDGVLDGYRLVVKNRHGELIAIDLAAGYESNNGDAQIAEYIENGRYVLVENAELHVTPKAKEGE